MLTLWHPARVFAKSVQVDGIQGYQLTLLEKKQKWEEILNQFEAMRNLSKLINKVNGNIMTLFLCGSILGYGIQLNQILTEINEHAWRRTVMQVCEMVSDVLVYAFAAQICHNVRVKNILINR